MTDATKDPREIVRERMKAARVAAAARVPPCSYVVARLPDVHAGSGRPIYQRAEHDNSDEACNRRLAVERDRRYLANQRACSHRKRRALRFTGERPEGTCLDCGAALGENAAP